MNLDLIAVTRTHPIAATIVALVLALLFFLRLNRAWRVYWGYAFSLVAAWVIFYEFAGPVYGGTSYQPSGIVNVTYFAVFTLGMLVALAEIISKFAEPLKSLGAREALIYHIFNGLIAVIALQSLIVLQPSEWDGPQNQYKAVIAAGLGSMMIMRSKLFSMKIGGQDMAFGPDQLITVFSGFLEKSIDRVRSQSRVDFVSATMDNLNFDRVRSYVETMMHAAQTLSKDQREEFEKDVNKIAQRNIPLQEKSYQLGFLILNQMGEDFTRRLFEVKAQNPEWLLRAPEPEGSAGAIAAALQRLPFRAQTEKYFAYGDLMSPDTLIQTLGRPPTEAEMKTIENPSVATVEGYQVQFSMPVEGAEGEGFATLAPKEGETVEGVVYDLTREVIEYFRRSQRGYERCEVETLIGAESQTATTWIAAEPVAGLLPSKRRLNQMIAAAEKRHLSSAYVAQLKSRPVLDGSQEPPDPEQGQSATAGGTP